MDAFEEFIRQLIYGSINDVVNLGRNYYLLEPKYAELEAKIQKKTGMHPFSAGLFLGEEKNNRFKPSIALIDLLGKTSEKIVVINEKAEWLFLCGRDIFASSVISSNVRGGPAIVVNERNEVLGYGLVKGRFDPNDTSDHTYVQNIMDKGNYLRREMGKRKRPAKERHDDNI